MSNNNTMRKTAFTFAGQGAQYTGMAQELYERYPVVKHTFQEASEILGQDAYALCMLPQERLNLTENAQLAIVVMEVAICRLLESRGVNAAAMAGFSIGEWAALICGGALTFETGLKLVNIRAQAMQRAVPFEKGGMLAVLGLSKDEIIDLCSNAGDGLWPANYNCPGQVVCAGTAEAIDKAIEYAAKKDIMVKKLAVSIPSHCPLMASAVEELRPAVMAADFRQTKCPIVCNVDALPVQDPQILRQNVLKQLISPVLYESSLHTLKTMGIDSLIEIGPGKVLTGLAKRTISDLMRLRVDDEKNFGETLAALEE